MFLWITVVLYLFLFFFGSWVLCWGITYPYMDTCSLFLTSESRLNSTYIKKDFVTIVGGDIERSATSEFSDRLFYCQYNIYTAINKYFKPKNKIKNMKVFNFALIAVFFVFFAALLSLTLHVLCGENWQIIPVSLIFSLIVVCRAKLLLVAILGLSDWINYSLLALSLFLLHLFLINNSLVLLFAFSFVSGLCFRNRGQDIVLLPASILFLFFIEGDLFCFVIVFFGFFLAVIDIYFVKIIKEPRGEVLWNVLKFGVAGSGKSGNEKNRYRFIIENIKDLYCLLSSSSIWNSQGMIILITPISLVYLLGTGSMLDIYIFILIYAFFILLSSLFVVHTVYGESGLVNGSYMGARQMYALFPSLALINGAAFGLLIVSESPVAIIYCVYICGYFLHQLYKFTDYLYAENITERGLIDYPKAPPLWSLELASQVTSLSRPAVVMGDHFIFGKLAGFYGWSEELRCVDVYSHLTDCEILEVINKYKVTHIFLTPFSCLKHPGSSLGKELLDSPLADILREVETPSPNLVCYATAVT